jgi:hypothetical protein
MVAVSTRTRTAQRREPGARPAARPTTGLSPLHGRVLELQRSAGNRAVTQLVRADRRASSELPVSVAAGTQAAIDAARDRPSPGQQARQLGAGGVRLHSGGRADALAAQLGAKAFTQGRDIFLRSDQLLRPDRGAATVAHELAHIQRGGASAGSVLKDSDAQMKEELDEDSPWYVGERELNRELMYSLERTPTPQASVISHPSSGGDVPPQPTLRPKDGEAPPPPAPTPEVPQTFDLEFVVDRRPLSFTGLSLLGAVKALHKVSRLCEDVRQTYRDLHQELVNNRHDHYIVGFWADKLGHGDPPPLTMWNAVGAFPLSEAHAAINAIPLSEEKAYAEYKAGEAAAAASSNAAMNYDRFLGTEQQARRSHAEDVFTGHISRAAEQLQKAANVIEVRRRGVFYYKSGQELGAQRGIKVTEAAIDTLEFAATAGVAGEVKGGLVVKSLVTAGTQAGLGMYAEAATQTGEMVIGDREWGHWDVKKIADIGLHQAVQGFVQGVAAGKLTGLIKGSAGALLTKMGIGKVSNKGLVVAGDLITEWLGAEGSVPFGRAAGLVVDRAEGNPQSFTGWGDFFSQSWDAMKGDAAYNAFTTTLGRGIEATREEPSPTGAPPPSEGAAAEKAQGGAGGGGGAAERPSAVPEHLGPGADARLSHDVSTGVPEHRGPEADARLSHDVSTGVPEHRGPEADAYASQRRAPDAGGVRSIVDDIAAGRRDAVAASDTELTSLVKEAGSWRELITELEAARQFAAADRLVKLRAGVAAEIESRFGGKAVGGASTERVSDIDFNIGGDHAGARLIEAEHYMESTYGGRWSEMFRVNFYTEAPRLTRYLDVLGRLPPAGQAKVRAEMTRATELYNVARMLEHVGDSPAGRERVLQLAERLGVDRNALIELALMSPGQRLTKRNQLHLEIDALEIRRQQLSGHPDEVEVAIEITRKQMEANYLTAEANIGPGANVQVVDRGKVEGAEAYQAALSHLEMAEHILHLAEGDPVRAARDYEIWKYVSRFVDAARGTDIHQDPRFTAKLQYFDHLSSLLYRVDRAAHSGAGTTPGAVEPTAEQVQQSRQAEQRNKEARRQGQYGPDLDEAIPATKAQIDKRNRTGAHYSEPGEARPADDEHMRAFLAEQTRFFLETAYEVVPELQTRSVAQGPVPEQATPAAATGNDERVTAEIKAVDDAVDAFDHAEADAGSTAKLPKMGGEAAVQGPDGPPPETTRSGMRVDTPVPEIESTGEAAAFLTQKWGSRQGRPPIRFDFTGVDRSMAADLAVTIDGLFHRYPGMVHRVDYIAVEALASGIHGVASTDLKIRIDQETFTVHSEAVARGVGQERSGVDTTADVMHTLVHEFGHEMGYAAETALDLRGLPPGAVAEHLQKGKTYHNRERLTREVRRIIAEVSGRADDPHLADWIAREVSETAAEGFRRSGDMREVVAEAFAEYYLKGDQARPFAKAIGEWLSKEVSLVPR